MLNYTHCRLSIMQIDALGLAGLFGRPNWSMQDKDEGRFFAFPAQSRRISRQTPANLADRAVSVL